jgi:hypothetical protein
VRDQEKQKCEGGGLERHANSAPLVGEVVFVFGVGDDKRRGRDRHAAEAADDGDG